MTRTRDDDVANNVIFEGELITFLHTAEERGAVGESELEALAFEHDLDDEELGVLRVELAAREVEMLPELDPCAQISRR